MVRGGLRQHSTRVLPGFHHGSTRLCKGSGGPGWFEARFHQGSTRVPPRFHQRSTKFHQVLRGLRFHETRVSTRSCKGGTLNLVQQWWNLWRNPCGTFSKTTPDHPAALAEPGGTLVEHWRNTGREILWNLTSNHPGPPRRANHPRRTCSRPFLFAPPQS